MTRFASGVAVILALSSAGASTSQQPADAQTVFRSTTDLVTIDVSVRSGRDPAAGLTSTDFVLLDNGVPQTLVSISAEALPVDVTVLLDNSTEMESVTGSYDDDVRTIAAMLRPADRLRVTTMSTYVSDLSPAQAAGDIPSIARVRAVGFPAPNDGIAAALMRPVDGDRRHLVVALTNGIDAASSLKASDVVEIARRSAATLVIGQMDMSWEFPPPGSTQRPFLRSGAERVAAFRCGMAGLCTPTRQFNRPHYDRTFDMLGQAAEITGGGMHLSDVFFDRTAPAIVSKALQDYRSRYVLRYTPKGVGREGWHAITVTVPGHSSYAIKARQGYTIDAAPPVPRATTSPPTAREPRSASPIVDALITAYDGSDLDAFLGRLHAVQNLTQVIKDFRAGSNPWPATPQREAAFVLELANAALQSGRVDARDAAIQLLEPYQRLVRGPLGPESFERFWLWAESLVLEGVNQPALARRTIDAALSRFPNESRFVLARAFVGDLALLPALSNSRIGRLSLDPVVARATEVLTQYDAAIAIDAVAAEARIRKGWLLHRMGRDDEALTTIEPADDGGRDRVLAYYRQLLLGQVLDALGRSSEAAAAYRSAMTIVPAAQSPRVGLMRHLLLEGNQQGAVELSRAIETAPTDARDPWWVYWQGDYRFYGDVFRRLWEQTR